MVASSPQPIGGADLDPSGSRYELIAKIASGGMATVYVGRLRGAGGFSRTVAIKRAHAHLVEDAGFKAMLVDEARLASRLHHPNVVAVLDVEELAGELRLVMDYVEGTSLADLVAQGQKADRRLPARIAVRIALDACAGLQAAHELCDEDGRPLGLVHRDVSPHNILVGLDGVARVADFGIAKHAEGAVSTTTGALKGKLGYMAPEYIEHGQLDARSDVFALGVVAWEALAGQKLFRGTNELDTLKLVVAALVPPLSSVASFAGKRLDGVLATALARSPEERFASAAAFANALETLARKGDLIATAAEVGAFVRELAGPALDKRRALVRERTAAARVDATLRIDPPAPPEGAAERPTVADKPSGPSDEAPSAPARAESSLTLEKPTSFSPAHLSPRSGWRPAVAVALAAAFAGVIGVLALRSRGGPVAPSPAPGSSVEIATTPTATAMATATATVTAVAPGAGATAASTASVDAARPAPGRPRGKGSAPAHPAPAAPPAPVKLEGNPY